MTGWITRLGNRSADPIGCQWDEAPLAEDNDWQRIAALALGAGAGRNQASVGPDARFALIKLRSRGVDVEVYRWTLRFEDGTILDLSPNCLLEGTETRPMLIAGRRLKGVTVEYAARKVSRHARLEIWAQPDNANEPGFFSSILRDGARM